MYKTLVPQGSPARQVILLPGTAFERLPFDEKPNNSRENSNGTVHPGKNFWQKKNISFEVLHFSRFYPNDRNFLYRSRPPLEAEGEKRRSFPRRVRVFCQWYN